MPPPPDTPPATFNPRLLSAALLGLALYAGWLVWRACSDPATPFLSASARAEWIVYPKPPDANPHYTGGLPAVFQCQFVLTQAPAQARLLLRALTHAQLTLNGRPTPLNQASSWKTTRAADISAMLRTGTNQLSVTVSNRFGPPALWLAVEDPGGVLLRTGRDWQVSLAGAAWEPAALAADPQPIRPGNDLYGRPRVIESLPRVWPSLIILTGVAAGLLLGWRWLSRQTLPPGPNLLRALADPAMAALIFALGAWLLLFANNLHQIAPLFGFDRDGHTEYINFLLDHGRLPLASDGWQMYHPPLYYLLAAGLLIPFDWNASSDAALLLLRAVSGVIGLGQILLLFLNLKLLFPNRPKSQALGLLLGAFLPAHLYLAHHVTNEGLAALLATAAIYFTLKSLRSDRPALRTAAAAGVCLGLALLTKFSAVLVAPFVLGALLFRTTAPARQAAPAQTPDPGCDVQIPTSNPHSSTPASSLQSLAWCLHPRPFLYAVAVLLAVCGWHYARVWYHFGNPLIGNWDPSLPLAWWQDPGYRTASWFFGFGQAFTTPMFSSLHSFADGLYSSLWGDALGSGSSKLAFRPPWNPDLANVGYWLALTPSLLVLAGLALAAIRLLRRPSVELGLLAGLLGAFGFGLVYMSLQVPSYAQVKAFYALPALLPFCALAVYGWEWLRQPFRAVAWLLMVLWALGMFCTFWIRSWDPHTHVARGISDADHGLREQALQRFARALQLDPHHTPARIQLAATLIQLGRLAEAREQIQAVGARTFLSAEGISLPSVPAANNGPTLTDRAELLFQSAAVLVVERRYEEALEPLRQTVALAPDHPVAWRQLAICLGLAGREAEAVAARQQALRINPYDLAQHQQQALACSLLGNDAQAVAHYRFALALQRDNPGLLNNLAWILATSPLADVRRGPEAAALAERACELTRRNEAVLLGTLAAAYAEAGEFDKAVATAEEAIARAQAAGQTDVAQKNQELLNLYRGGKAYRAPAARPGRNSP
jgi:tetratricopeptide (TPR) repeat protein